MKARTIIMALSAFSAVLLGGCQSAPKAERQVTPEYEIKDGYYMSEADDSYIHIGGGCVELVGYDFSAGLREAFDEGIEQGFISPEDSFERFYEDSLEQAQEDAKPKPYIVKSFPNMSEAILATEWDESDNGGGSWSGYRIIDSSTLFANGANYVYAGEELSPDAETAKIPAEENGEAAE